MLGDPPFILLNWIPLAWLGKSRNRRMKSWSGERTALKLAEAEVGLVGGLGLVRDKNTINKKMYLFALKNANEENASEN